LDRQHRMDEYIRNFHEITPIARYFGMKLSFNHDYSAVVELPYNPGLDHSLGGIHGGVYATLLDTAGWFTAAMAHDIDCWVATAEMSMHLLEPAKGTALRAVGKLLKSGKRQNIVEMFLYDENERLVGHATGTFIILTNLSFLSVVRGEAVIDTGGA
jgi:uncharacterized protein (TIGR00369 family)